MKCLKICNMNSWAVMKVSVCCLDLNLTYVKSPLEISNRKPIDSSRFLVRGELKVCGCI